MKRLFEEKLFDYFLILITVIAAVNFQFATWYYSPQDVETVQSIMRVSFWPIIPLLALWLINQFPITNQTGRFFVLLVYWVWIAMMMLSNILILLAMSTGFWIARQYILENYWVVYWSYLVASAVIVGVGAALLKYYTRTKTSIRLIIGGNVTGFVTFVIFLWFCFG